MATWTTRKDDLTPSLLPQPRSEGLHLTDVLKRLHSYQPGQRYDGSENYQHSVYAEMGKEYEWAFKERLQQQDCQRFFDPGEVCVNIGTDDNPIPFYLTPDLCEWMGERRNEQQHDPDNPFIGLQPNEIRVLDCKWTTISSDRWDPRLETPATKYIRDQLACYCKVANTIHGGFFIRYFHGNYADKRVDHLPVDCEFEQWEIELLWADVVVMGRDMHNEINANDVYNDLPHQYKR